MPLSQAPAQEVDEVARLREELTRRRDERGHEDSGFVHPREARLTLTVDRLQILLTPHEWFEPSRHLNAIWHNLHLVVCTFLLIEEFEWSCSGKYTFIDDVTPRLRDEILPFNYAI